MTDKITALTADFQQLKTELGAYGVNLTPGARASLAAVEDGLQKLAAVLAPQQQDKPKAKLVGG